MMKTSLSKLSVALSMALAGSAAHAETGNLFTVSATGSPATISITLCLNAIAQLSCQTYTVSSLNLNIGTTIPNHLYANAGIKINTPGYAPANCALLANGFCSFSTSSTATTNIPITSTSAIVFPGTYYNGGGHIVPLSYTSNDGGNDWTISSPMPLPAGAISTIIYKAACDSTKTMCTTVGQFYNGSHDSPISYTSSNGGGSWALSSSLPAIPGGAVDAYLYDVSCNTSGGNCIAVGSYYTGTIFLPIAYKSSNGGNTWVTNVAFSTPGGSTFTSLQSIACSSTGSMCTAVGYYNNGTNNLPIAYTSSNGGNSWVISSAFPPAPGGASQNHYLNSVACNSAGNQCSAVGYYSNGTNYFPLSYTSTNGGSAWSLSTTLPPTPVGATYTLLNGITCHSTGGSCIAVGYYTAGSTSYPLIYMSSNGGVTWKL